MPNLIMPKKSMPKNVSAKSIFCQMAPISKFVALSESALSESQSIKSLKNRTKVKLIKQKSH